MLETPGKGLKTAHFARKRARNDSGNRSFRGKSAKTHCSPFAMAKSIYLSIYIVKCLEKVSKVLETPPKSRFQPSFFLFSFSPRFSGGKSQWYGMPLAFPAAGGASRLPRSLLAAAKRDGNLGVLHFSRGFLSGRCRNRGGAVGIRKMPGKGLRTANFAGKGLGTPPGDRWGGQQKAVKCVKKASQNSPFARKNAWKSPQKC